tara:strand:+ start:585 stop:767 length:183 start_codon:yes stop_codon:yes gene_type:complete
MPKKKLTKTQVKRKIKTTSNAIYDMLLDKMGHGTASFVPFSLDKLIELQKVMDRARNKVK